MESLSDSIFKYLIIGDALVGKSSILKRFCHGLFQDNVESTIGVDFLPYTITINNTPIKLQIWDTAGQEQYRSLSQVYYRNAIGVMIVFSFTDGESFEHLDDWFNSVRTLCHPKAQILLIGNKEDLTKDHQVSKRHAEQYASSHNVKFIATSAKTNVGIQEAFYDLTRNVAQSVLRGEIILAKINTTNKSETKNENSSENGCC